MIITLLNENYVATDVIDDYESFIWTDRYNSPGDFEYYSAMTKERFDRFKPGLYLANDQSEHHMVIENVEIVSDPEAGNHIKVTGRSIESYLDRRVVCEKTYVHEHGRVWKIIKTLFVDNFTVSGPRRIPGFTFIDPADEVKEARMMEEAEYLGDNILDLINTLTQDNDLGWKLLHTDDGKYSFYLYLGIDKSDTQDLENAVIFSPYFDNIFDSDYIKDTTTYKNVAYVKGKDVGEGESKETIIVSVVGNKTEKTGLARREVFMDGSDVEEDPEIPDPDYELYKAALKQFGLQELKKCKIKNSFSGNVDVNGLFVYGRDFKIGDIVTFENEYGNKARVRVEELIFSDGPDGYTNYPSFTVLEDEEDN